MAKKLPPNNIRSERERAHLSREQLGVMIGRSHQVIGKWERGDTTPCLSDAIKLAQEFNCSVDYLSGITDVRLPYGQGGVHA